MDISSKELLLISCGTLTQKRSNRTVESFLLNQNLCTIAAWFSSLVGCWIKMYHQAILLNQISAERAWAIIYRGSDHQKTTKNYQRWSKLTVRKKKQYGGLVRGDSSRFSHQNQVKEITKEKIYSTYFLRIWKNGSF